MNQNISIRNLAMGAFLALGLATISGCSTLEDVPENATGAVQVTSLEVAEGGEESLTKAQAEPQTVIVPVSDDWGMVCTLAPDPVSKTRAAMTAGVKYRVVAYDAGTSMERGSQLVTAGSEASAVTIKDLAVGSYDFVFYSYNNTTDPGVPSAGSITVAAGTDLLYGKITNVSVVAATVKKVTATLSHKFSGVRVVANSAGLPGSPTITTISGKFSNGYGATLAASGGTLTQGTTSLVDVTWPAGAANQRTSNTLGFYATGSSSSYTLSFPTNSLNIGGTQNGAGKLVSFNLTLVAGTRYTLKVMFAKCTAKISSTVTKVFMCHNLGADQTADPVTPSYKLNGAYWQWGNSAFSVGAPTNAAGAEPGYTWNPNNYSNNATWPSNPCPTGFHVPTVVEFSGLVTNNTKTRVGTWTGGTASFDSGTKFGTGNLYLPAAGRRQASDGALLDRGIWGYYWSSDTAGSEGHYLSTFNFNPSAITNTLLGYKDSGMTIRCIAD